MHRIWRQVDFQFLHYTSNPWSLTVRNRDMARGHWVPEISGGKPYIRRNHILLTQNMYVKVPYYMRKQILTQLFSALIARIPQLQPSCKHQCRQLQRHHGSGMYYTPEMLCHLRQKLRWGCAKKWGWVVRSRLGLRQGDRRCHGHYSKAPRLL